MEEIGKLRGGHNPLPQTSWERRRQLDHQLLFTSSGIGVTWRWRVLLKGMLPPEGLKSSLARPFLRYLYSNHTSQLETMDNTDAMITYNKHVFLVKQEDEEKKIVMVGFFYDRGEMPGGLLKGTKIDSSAFC